MNKELEALRKKILKNCRCDIKCLEYDNLLKALTPPTEEEVCEALSTHFENIRYSQLFVSYVGREFEVSYEPFLSQVIAYKKDDGNVSIELELPPKLGKMIFAFYEGIESK